MKGIAIREGELIIFSYKQGGYAICLLSCGKISIDNR
jgi:hypothetical protein